MGSVLSGKRAMILKKAPTGALLVCT